MSSAFMIWKGLVHRKKFRVPDMGKYPRNRLIPPHNPNIGFLEQKQPWVFAAEFYDSMQVNVFPLVEI